MTPIEIVLLIAFVSLAFFSLLAQGAAYRNGVTDGYGFSKEPTCPGYRTAGHHLRTTMAHRWPELRDAVPGRIIPPQGGSSSAPPMRNRMVVCADCGNKRCPRAGGYFYACTGSNAPEQVGTLAPQFANPETP